MVAAIAELAAHSAVHSIFTVLDRVAFIDERKGRFRLLYVADGQEFELNPDDGEMLHDMLNDADEMPRLYRD